MAQLLRHAKPRNYVFGVSANVVGTSTFLKVFQISINIFQGITIKSICREFCNYDPAKYVYEPLHNLVATWILQRQNCNLLLESKFNLRCAMNVVLTTLLQR